MKQWHIFDKVYRRWVVCFIGTKEEFLAELSRIGFKLDTDWLLAAKGACLELNATNNDVGNDATVIWMEKYETSTLIHEIAHLVMMLFDQVGVPISRENTESFSFYSEYWFNQIQRARRKHPDGNKPKNAR